MAKKSKKKGRKKSPAKQNAQKKTVKKKEASMKAATKRANTAKKSKRSSSAAKPQKKKESQNVEVTTTHTTQGIEKVAPTVTTQERIEEVKDVVTEVSDSIFNKYRDYTMIGITVILCIFLFFTWQNKAEVTWRKTGQLKVEKELASSSFLALGDSAKVEKLEKMLKEYAGTAVQYTLCSKLGSIYYSMGSDQAKNSKENLQLLKTNLEKAKAFYGKLTVSSVPSGIQIMAKRNLENIEKEIQLLSSPPLIQKQGVFNQKASSL